MTIRLLLVDDHPFYREGVRLTLPVFDPSIEIVGEASAADDAVALIESLRPDVVLMDLGLPGVGGVEATRRIVQSFPTTAVLILTMADDDSVFAAVNAGARGYLVKDATADDLSRAVRAVHRGESIFSPTVATRVRERLVRSLDPDASVFPQLSARERAVLARLSRDESVAVIATQMQLTEKTVRNYIANILTKLPARSKLEAAALARNAGLGS